VKDRTGELPIRTPKMIVKHLSDDDPNHRLIIKIHSSRQHESTNKILEYRLEISPAQLVRLAEQGILGTRPPLTDDQDDDDEEEGKEENGKKIKTTKPQLRPDHPLRVWMPASMVRLAEPWLVAEYEGKLQEKAKKKNKKGKVNANAKTKLPVDDRDTHSSDSQIIPTSKSMAFDKVNNTKKDRAKAIGTDDSSDLKTFYPVHKVPISSIGKPVVSRQSKLGVTISKMPLILDTIDAKMCSASNHSRQSVSDKCTVTRKLLNIPHSGALHPTVIAFPTPKIIVLYRHRLQRM